MQLFFDQNLILLAMEIPIFTNCRTLDEVKREYKRLALIYHPDRGGDTGSMQEINRQYDEIMRNGYFNIMITY